LPARLLIDALPGGVRRLTLSNPDRKNALDAPVLETLALELSEAKSAGVRCWLLTGHNDAFSAGYDVQSLKEYSADESLPDHRLQQVLDLLSAHPAPSVAYVNGAAYGAGFELACACDFRVGDSNAVFCMPPARLGVVYSARGIHRVASLVGLGRAKLLFLTARRVLAEEARLLGLLDVITFEGNAEREAVALCTELALHAPLAVKGMKRTFELLSKLSLTDAESTELERLRREAFNSDDAKEGRAAFLERRAPRFTGK
jgi:enoyl-CoA hydratase/carnithine racemase